MSAADYGETTKSKKKTSMMTMFDNPINICEENNSSMSNGRPKVKIDVKPDDLIPVSSTLSSSSRSPVNAISPPSPVRAGGERMAPLLRQVSRIEASDITESSCRSSSQQLAPLDYLAIKTRRLE